MRYGLQIGEINALCFMSRSMLNVRVHVACAYQCCMSASMLQLHVHAHAGHGHGHWHSHEHSHGHGHGHEQEQGRMKANILKQTEANWSKYLFFRFALFRSKYFKRITANWSEYFYTNTHESKQIFSKQDLALLRFIAKNGQKLMWDTLLT